MNADKEKKYDRQLRLWGDHGQIALENARVCLINAGATGTEVLKNLILPGIGFFTIIDGETVKQEDFGNNFFVALNHLNKSRAAVTTELLSELNEDVSGDYVEESVDSLLENKPDFFSAFSVVIATDIMERTLLNLCSHLWAESIPLVVCRSFGPIGCLRVVVREHCVVESHPDNCRPDLRLDCPFPALEEFCHKQVMETMTKKEHSHTPWLVILFKYIQKFQDLHNRFPHNYKDKTILKELIRKGMRHREDGESSEDLENFEEAIKSVNSAVMHAEIPSEIQALFEDSRCTSLSASSGSFWFLVRALKHFVENEGHGRLPLRGSLPDMTSDSERYVRLQEIYRDQANTDAKYIEEYVRQLCVQYDREFGEDGLSNTTVRLFAKNSAFLRVMSCRSLEEEMKLSPARSDELSLRPCCDENDELCWFLMLRAADRFRSERGRWPGQMGQASPEADIPLLKTHLNRVLAEGGLAMGVVKDDFIQEMCRVGGAELHSVAAFMGGVAAQEVIKLITHQFVPQTGVLIYNAVSQKTRHLEF